MVDLQLKVLPTAERPYRDNTWFIVRSDNWRNPGSNLQPLIHITCDRTTGYISKSMPHLGNVDDIKKMKSWQVMNAIFQHFVSLTIFYEKQFPVH